MKKITTLLLLVFKITMFGQASTTKSVATKGMLALELDPAPFILKGYSVSIKFSAKQTSHFTGMCSVYGSNFPDGMMDKRNYNLGFRNMRIKTSGAFFLDYFLNNRRTGLHAGPSVFYYSRNVQKIDKERDINFNTVYPNLRIGYVWKFSRRCGFYVNPWLNVGREFYSGKHNNGFESGFLLNNMSYIVALHLGYMW